MSIVERIKKLASPLGYSLASIERDANLGHGTIRKWDTNTPSADKLLKVALLLNTSMDYLMTGKFATCQALSDDENKFLYLFRQLPETKQEYFSGIIEGYLIKAEESVAADPPLKKAK